MVSTKELSFSIDINKLNNQIEKQLEETQANQKEFNISSTVFALGSDPQIATKKNVESPEFLEIRILKDRLDNPYLQLHWRVLRENIDSGRIIGFNVFRRRSTLPPPSFRGIKLLSRAAVERLARKNKRIGKFFEDRKSIYNIKRGSVPLDVLNPNLNFLKRIGLTHSFQDNSDDFLDFSQSSFEKLLARKDFEKLAYIDYTKFLQEEKNKFLFVQDRNFSDLSYKDKKVGYWETFEYFVTAVTKEMGNIPSSDIILVTVEDSDFVSPPKSLLVKQISEKEVQLSVCINARDNVLKAIFYRKAEDEIEFEKLIESENVSDCINISDSTLEYGKTYTYRVFLENIHGNLSEPKEITFFSSVQKIIPPSRSNSLKIPIISAIQDQNSNFIKIVISPNDPRVAYYELTRKDLSIHERKFSVPSKNETNYGAIGWLANKFFVNSQRISTSEENALNTKTVLSEIVFIDDTVDPNHIYKYRIRGVDLAGNGTSYAFSTVRAVGKKSIRSPINIKSEILRNFPYRIKISWNDDNTLSLVSTEELFTGESTVEKKASKIIYKIQRRNQNEIVYESFPLTANKYFIDEGPTNDAVLFESKLTEDIYIRTENITTDDAKISILNAPKRAFKLPGFLKKNEIYFYRIVAIAENGEESNPSEEFKVLTILELSNPLDFGIEVVNSKVKPLVARLFWKVDPFKAVPDYWTIERKFDASHDSFAYLGKSYLLSEFFDRNLQSGNTYIYRIKAYDAIGRESPYFETRITL